MRSGSESRSVRRGGIFIDRDDTIIVDARYLDNPDGVILLPGVRAALHRAARTHRLFLFSNQSGVSRGYFTWQQVDAVNARMFALLGGGEKLFAATCMAAESPGEPGVYRKPSPRFILECIDQFALDPGACWMVGDRLSDLQAGIRAGIRAALIAPPDRPADEGLSAYVRRHAIPVYATLAAFLKTIR